MVAGEYTLNKPYIIVRQRERYPNEIKKYWKALEEAETLALRICNVDNPTTETAMQLILRFPDQFYYVEQDGKIIAEFMMENFTGKAAQIHFSMHPENPLRQSLTLASEVTSDILDTWKAFDSEESYLHTLFGLTPVTNRVACMFVLRAGFRKVGILPSGIRDRGQIVDAMMTIKQRTH